MLFLYIFLVSCCLPGSMGAAGDEFQQNLRDLVAQANKEIFFPVLKGKFQCSCVPYQLENTIKRLRVSFKNDPENLIKNLISVMEKNMESITSTLNKTHTQPKTISCQMADANMTKGTVLKYYRRFFEKVNEYC